MTKPHTPLPWRLDDIAQRVIGERHGETVTIATGLIASDARYLVQAANLHLRLIDLALKIRTLLVQLSDDDIAALRLELIKLFNTLLIHEGDHS